MKPIVLALLLAATSAAGCIGDVAAPDESDLGTARTDNADVEDAVHAFDGTITGTPASPGVEAFTFDVPKGATGIGATLTYDASLPVTSLRLELVTPTGESAGRGFPEKAGQASVGTLEPPASGAWTARVTSERALDVAFTLDVVVSFIVPTDNVLADSVDMPAGSFVEINLIMEENATFAWEYVADGGSVNWNVHSHENGETTYHERGSGESHEGSFTAPKRQIYSIMWESLSPSPISLSYKVEGAFRVHSHSQ